MARGKKRPLPQWCKNAHITMTEKDLDTNDVADGIGKTRQYVSSIVNGRVYTEAGVKQISNFLGISDQYD